MQALGPPEFVPLGSAIYWPPHLCFLTYKIEAIKYLLHGKNP